MIIYSVISSEFWIQKQSYEMLKQGIYPSHWQLHGQFSCMKARGNFKIEKIDKKYSNDKIYETKTSNKYEKQLISM